MISLSNKNPKNLTRNNYAKTSNDGQVGQLLVDVRDTKHETSGSKLTSDNRSRVEFKLAIQHTLANRYQFKNLRSADIKMFSNFLKETVGKGLTITEVEKLFLRTKSNPRELELINGEEHEVCHFGKNRNSFRIHGYYNDDGYFVIYRIDPKHEYHKVS